MTYKEKLEQAVKEFQSDVERFFDVSLGNIGLKSYPEKELHKKPNTTQYAGASFLIFGENNFIPTETILYNPSISDLISQSLVNYITIHEMCHFGHAEYIGAKKYVSSKIFNEVIADYITCELFNKKNQEIPKEPRLEERIKDVLALKEHLLGIGKNLKEYLNDENSIFYDKEILKKHNGIK